MELIINKTWAMPSGFTFGIKPIKELIEKYHTAGITQSVDPFSGKNSPARVKNDINPEREADFHLDALEFLKTLPNSFYDVAFFDPPYSFTQIKQLYDGLGKSLTCECNMKYWANIKTELARVVRVGGIVISCGWNSNGIGKTRGFEQIEILLVAHGGNRNDTIVTVERRQQ